MCKILEILDPHSQRNILSKLATFHPIFQLPHSALEDKVQVESYCSPQCDPRGSGCQEALQVRDGTGAIFFDIFFDGDYSLGPYDDYDLPSPFLVLVQEAFEGGRLRLSNFVSWMRPTADCEGMKEEMVVSEERCTLTGCKEGLVWESKV